MGKKKPNKYNQNRHQGYRLVIAGCRNFKNFRFVDEAIAEYLEERHVSEIVTGGAKGVDELAKAYALTNNIPHKEFLPDWERYGKGAGPKRNRKMAVYGDALLAIWDYNSRGTMNMVDNMRWEGKPIKIVLIPID